jgi:hypothetical protein
MANYRNKKLLELCREIPCQSCGRSDGTVCAAHSNQQRDGKGTGIKASDAAVASLCSKCHFELDNGKNLTKEDRREIWELAHRLTIRHFIENDMLVVK